MSETLAGPAGRASGGHQGGGLRGADEREFRAFLALEMGGSLGDDGDVAGVRLADLVADPDLKAMGVSLWRQLKAPKPLAERIEDAGLTVGDLFAPGMTEFVTTSSTAEELARYRQKLAFRADLLESLLEETLAELETVEAMRPSAALASPPGDGTAPARRTD